jgi:hypothetical protein
MLSILEQGERYVESFGGDVALKVREIAKVTHEVNKAYCEAIGDFSQVPWEQAADWQKESAIKGVTAVLDGTANSPEEQHAAWSAEKVATGWMFGEVKDAEAKTHPCLVPYEQLPQAQKVKDFLFRAVIKSMAQ